MKRSSKGDNEDIPSSAPSGGMGDAGDVVPAVLTGPKTVAAAADMRRREFQSDDALPSVRRWRC